MLSQADTASLEVTGWIKHVLLRDSDHVDYQLQAVLPTIKYVYLKDGQEEEEQETTPCICLPPTHLIGFYPQGAEVVQS